MAPRGIQEWYYTRDLPARAVAIAEIQTDPFGPADLVDVSNTPFQQGTLGIWKSTSNLAGPADFVAPDYGQSVIISGVSLYYISNQYYQITNQVAGAKPLYFYHPLPIGVTDVTILALDGTVQASAIITVTGTFLYHDMGGDPFYVRYANSNGFLIKELLQYNLVLSPAPYAPSLISYVAAGRTINVASTGAFNIRFMRPNGYEVLVPYNTLPNIPWFVRVSFGLTPVAPEWARQVFLPQRPYMLASWVPGQVLTTNLIELERKDLFYDATHLPDVLVFDKNNTLKYALDGTTPGSLRRRGGLYPWKRGLIKEGVDPHNARLEVSVPLDPTDIVFGFYSYNEPDVVYTALDVNPFTNPAIKNRVIQFYFKSNGTDPFHYIYHQVVDQNGAAIAGLTNDPSPGTGTATQFAQVIVGGSVGVSRFTAEDSRTRGGGLLPQWQNRPEAINFWDLGYWDGKPYPAGGGMIVHLPSSILGRLTRSDIQSKVESILPMGVIPVIFYYDPDGTESR